MILVLFLILSIASMKLKAPIKPFKIKNLEKKNSDINFLSKFNEIISHKQNLLLLDFKTDNNLLSKYKISNPNIDVILEENKFNDNAFTEHPLKKT